MSDSESHEMTMKRANVPTDDVDLARPEVRFDHTDSSAVAQLPPLPWYAQPGVLFGAAACAALVAATVLIATWQPDGAATSPAVTTAVSTTVAVPAPPPPQLPATAPAPVTETVVVQQPTPGVARRGQVPQATRVAPPPKAPPANPPSAEPVVPVVPPTLPPLFPHAGGSTTGGSGEEPLGGTDPVSPYPGDIYIGPSDTISVPPTPGRDPSIPDCSDLPPDTLC